MFISYSRTILHSILFDYPRQIRLIIRAAVTLDPLTHLPRNDIPSGILSSNVTFLRATYFVPAVCDDRANQFFEKSCIRPMRPESARNQAVGRKTPSARLEINYLVVEFSKHDRHRRCKKPF